MIVYRSSSSTMGTLRLSVFSWINRYFQRCTAAILNQLAFSINERTVLLKLIENSLYLHPVCSGLLCLVNKTSQSLLQDASFFPLLLFHKVNVHLLAIESEASHRSRRRGKATPKDRSPPTEALRSKTKFYLAGRCIWDAVNVPSSI